MVGKPNFFLVGAPKCGTTSLASWLRQHPNVYLPHKEIHFFNTDHVTPWRPTATEYAALYEGVQRHHTAVGDASVWYLASQRAIPAIQEYNEQAKFIACVRNPVEMAQSLHNQQVFEGTESITDFREAWAAQEGRSNGRNLRLGAEAFHLMYGPACRLGEQLERAANEVGDRLLIVMLEDINARPSETLSQILEFLGLPAAIIQFKSVNKAQRRKSSLLKQATRALGIVKRKTRIPGSLGILSRINAWNRQERPWTPNREMDEVLIDYFADDIARLSALTGRDLRHWLVPGRARPGAAASVLP